LGKIREENREKRRPFEPRSKGRGGTLTTLGFVAAVFYLAFRVGPSDVNAKRPRPAPRWLGKTLAASVNGEIDVI